MRKRSCIYLLFISLCFVFGLTSCVTVTPIRDFYTPWLTEETLSSFDQECFLQTDEEPTIYYSTNISTDYNYANSIGYTCIGDSNFNGPSMEQSALETELNEIAKSKGARMVLYSQEYTNTINGIFSTSYGIYSTNTKRYDYDVYYFVYTPSYIFDANPLGFLSCELTQRQKEEFKRNTGLIVTTVWNKSPAFYANIALNDIIVKINDYAIIDYDSYWEALNKIDYSSPIQIEFIRNGVLQVTTINL